MFGFTLEKGWIFSKETFFQLFKLKAMCYVYEIKIKKPRIQKMIQKYFQAYIKGERIKIIDYKEQYIL